MSDQFLQAARQNIRRDSFVGSKELFVRPESPQHHVADNQQRPAVTEDLHRSIQGTSGATLVARPLPWHFSSVAYFNLHFASDLLQTVSRPAIFGRKLKSEDENEPSNNEEIACSAIGSATV
jgi:hypothetical protein